jgi:archaellum component FlaG (FlaF/FlaG flagellin family)
MTLGTTNHLILFIVLLSTSWVQAAITTSDTHISTNRNSNRALICSYYSANYSTSDI